MRNACTGLALAALAGLAACSGTRPEVMKAETAEGLTGSYEEYMEKARDLIAKRAHEEAALREAIDSLEKAHRVNPGQKETLGMLSRSYYRLGYSFGDPMTDEERMDVYLKSKNYGWETLMLVPEFKAAMDAEKPINDEAVALIPQDFVEEMFIMASAWGRWGELKGILTQAFDIPKVKALVDRSVAADEKAIKGGPHRFLGAYFVKIPLFAGKDPEKSRIHFEKSIELFPGYLENRYMYAAYYAVDADDVDLYTEQLEYVLNYKVDPDDPLRLEQETAQRMAKEALANKDDYF